MSILDKLKGWFASSSSSHSHENHADHHEPASHGSQDSMWDNDNNPIGYIPGATPGFSQIGSPGKLNMMSLALKIQEGARMGFDFVQIDIETISELMEPDLSNRALRIQDAQKIYAGVHGPVQGNTALDLGTAIAPFWHRHHLNLLRTAYGGSLIGAKYILFHTSAQGRPAITFGLGEGRAGQAPLFSFNGQVLGQWIDDVQDGKFHEPNPNRGVDSKKISDFKEWFIASFLEVFYRQQGRSVDPLEEKYFQEEGNFDKGFDKLERIVEEKTANAQKVVDSEVQAEMDRLNKEYASIEQKQQKNQQDQIRLQEIGNRAREITNPEYKKRRVQMELSKDPEYIRYSKIYGINGHFGKEWYYEVFKFWVRQGSPAEEAVAYRAVAKYLYMMGDPLWSSIVGSGIDPDHVVAAADSNFTSMQQWANSLENKKKAEEYGKKYANESRSPQKLAEEIIAAVCAKYIEGHIFVKDVWSMGCLPEREHHTIIQQNESKSVYEFCESNQRTDLQGHTTEWPMQIFIENEQPISAPEGELRLMRASHHIALIKALDDGKLTSFCLDFEHMMINMIDPIEETNQLKPGDGKYIRMVHMNSVVPFRAAHGPIRRLSRDMETLYGFLYNLRRAGMKDAYIIWEMGGHGVEQSAVAYRAMIKALNKDLDPKLFGPGTPEYDELLKILYGIDDTFLAQQEVAIRQHALDPLKGLIMHPEEEHGFLSKTALEKGGDKLGVWSRGHLK